MALLPRSLSPARVGRALNRAAAAVVRRVLGIQRTPPGEQLRRVPDDLPRDTLFSQPLTCEATGAQDTDAAGDPRAVFRVLVRDVNGKRCPDLSVEASITGPTRRATGQTTTSMLGVATFRMADGPGDYRLEVTDVAAHALDWDRDSSTTTATTTVS